MSKQIYRANKLLSMAYYLFFGFICFVAYLIMDVVEFEDLLMFLAIIASLMIYEYVDSPVFEFEKENFRFKASSASEYSKWYEKHEVAKVERTFFRSMIELDDGTRLSIDPFVFKKDDIDQIVANLSNSS